MTSRQVIVGSVIPLEITVKNALGHAIDADALPQIEILNDLGAVQVALTSTNIVRIDVGTYRYNYTVPLNGSVGIWVDHWRAVASGFTIDTNLNFIVLSASADIEVAGEQIGDEPVTQTSFTQEEIHGINILLAQLKARVKNNQSVETTDEWGNITYVACNIFTDEELVWFLQVSLSEFNQTPHFTDYHFSDQVIYERYAYVIVEGAFIIAMAAQMLIEVGKEFTIQDNGVSMNPPPISAMLNNQLSAFVARHGEALKAIKCSIKPAPIGFGGYRLLGSNPALTRLRHLRERRIL